MSEASGHTIWYSHRVSYGETDMMGVLYYAEYLHIFERGRNEFIRSFDLSYKEVEKRGVFLPVREANCRYRRPARYDDLLQLRVGSRNWRHASFEFWYELYDEPRQNIMATGMTQHALVGADGRPMAIPDWFKSIFNA